MMLVPPPGLTHIHSPIHHCYWGLFRVVLGLFGGCSRFFFGFFPMMTMTMMRMMMINSTRSRVGDDDQSDDDDDQSGDHDDDDQPGPGWRQSK